MLRKVAQFFVRYVESFVPDAFLYAAILTFITVIAARIWTPASTSDIISCWYEGLWGILAFALQMALILATGVTLADAPAIKKVLQRIADLPKTQASAAITVFLAEAIGAWLNWGFGLVIGALLAREIGRRLRNIDFAFVVASAYMGYMVWASGLSSSIALATATHGSSLNIMEKVTGSIAGLHQTIFTSFNLVPVILLVLLTPIAIYFMGPGVNEMKKVDPATFAQSDAQLATPREKGSRTFASMLNNAWAITLLLIAMGVAYEWHTIRTKGFSLDLNGFIFFALILGMLFHWRPINYVRSFNDGAKAVGPILLQFPLYGGIMGIMSHTGLAAVMSQGFVAFSTHATLPFWTFISSNIISLFVPSGGGHWAVQGPFIVPAAVKLHVSVPLTAMAVAMGEETANMIQPFWALPLLALAGLGFKDIMGYCIIGLIIGLVVFGGALLVFA